MPNAQQNSFIERFSDQIEIENYEVKVDGEMQTREREWIKIKPEDVLEVLAFAKDDQRFDFLRMVSGVDYEEEIEVAYFLFSYETKQEVHIKTRVPKDKPELESVQSIWPAANWHEREVYDLLGVRFLNHPDMRRILLPDDWEGHPLRKDYREPKSYNDMSTTREYLTGMPELPTLKPEEKPAETEEGAS